MAKWDGTYIFRLYRYGQFYADRSMTCGAQMAQSAVAQWRRNGFTVRVIWGDGKVH